MPAALIPAVTSTARAIPIRPPMRQMEADSSRNCSRMLRCLAPIALRMPISFVRSVTDTNMIFMTPMPPTNSEIPVTSRPISRTTPTMLLNAPIRESSLLIEKSSPSAGRSLRILRISPMTSNSRSRIDAIPGALTAMSTFSVCRPPNTFRNVLIGINTWRSKSGPPKVLPPTSSMTPPIRNRWRPILMTLLIGLLAGNRPSATALPMITTFFL